MTEVRNMQDVAMKVAAERIVNTIMDSINYQEDPRNRIITECEFEVSDDERSLNIWIKSDCDGWCEDVKILRTITWVSHANNFTSNDFIGLSEKMALDMLDVQRTPDWYSVVVDNDKHIVLLEDLWMGCDDELPFV